MWTEEEEKKTGQYLQEILDEFSILSYAWLRSGWIYFNSNSERFDRIRDWSRLISTLNFRLWPGIVVQTRPRRS